MNIPSLRFKAEELEGFSKQELIQLLLTALDAVRLATENMQKLTEATLQANTRIASLSDQLKTLEAELIVLRNRP